MSDKSQNGQPEDNEKAQSDEASSPLAQAPDSELRALLRRALPDTEPEPDLLGAVQQKLRKRSGGKFYANGWSVAKHPPISTYLITSLVMLAIVIFLYAALFSLSGTAVEIDPTPKPIQVLPP